MFDAAGMVERRHASSGSGTRFIERRPEPPVLLGIRVCHGERTAGPVEQASLGVREIGTRAVERDSDDGAVAAADDDRHLVLGPEPPVELLVDAEAVVL